jgi:hypothetical protein
MKLYPEDGSTKTLRNSGNHLPDKTVQYPSRPYSSKPARCTANSAVTLDYLICQGCRRSCRTCTALHISPRNFSRNQSTSDWPGALQYPRFSRNFIFVYFANLSRENSSFLKIWEEWRTFYMQTNKYFWSYLAQFSEWEMSQTKIL